MFQNSLKMHTGCLHCRRKLSLCCTCTSLCCATVEYMPRKNLVTKDSYMWVQSPFQMV
jgi:hypothetical protein